jgi:hypothetical protein
MSRLSVALTVCISAHGYALHHTNTGLEIGCLQFHYTSEEGETMGLGVRGRSLS